MYYTVEFKVQVKSFVKLYAPVVSTLAQLDSFPELVSRRELDIITELITMLEPFDILTKTLSADLYVTISIVIPSIMCLKAEMNRSSPQNDLTKEFKRCLSSHIAKRFGNVELNKICAVYIGSSLQENRFLIASVLQSSCF